MSQTEPMVGSEQRETLIYSLDFIYRQVLLELPTDAFKQVVSGNIRGDLQTPEMQGPSSQSESP